MTEPVQLFVDFDDTLSDYLELGRQYVTRLANLLSEEFGGVGAEWASRLIPAISASLERYAIRFGDNPQPGFAAWAESERAKIVTDLFTEMNLALPAGETPLAIADRLQLSTLTCCSAAFPGARQALSEIAASGVRIHSASSWGSAYIHGALMGAGLENFVDRKFGPDLIDCPKEGPEFYRRIFVASEVSPSQAIVLDDLPVCLDWAEGAGARVIQARIKPGSPEPDFPIAITQLSQLPAAIAKMVG